MNKIILTVVVLLGAMSCAPVRDKEYDLEPLEDVVDSRALENSYEISSYSYEIVSLDTLFIVL